jgi:hypothetical protein
MLAYGLLMGQGAGGSLGHLRWLNSCLRETHNAANQKV